jgi:bifunctional enzyme CysN/CysC
MPIVVVGHVDHGKSTVVGRLLADTGSLPDGKLDQVRELCRRTSKPFEYAFLLDALKDERDQGITIDAARVFFRSAQRPYVVIDAPGHVEFLRNMITGAARADAALLVVDAREGVRENSRRHATMLALLGVPRVAVLVNKMDLVGWSEARFEEIRSAFDELATRFGFEDAVSIPVSAVLGDNIALRSAKTPWYKGQPLLDYLGRAVARCGTTTRQFRFPVQLVVRAGQDFRGLAGTITSGSIAAGEEVVEPVSGRRGKIRRIVTMGRDLAVARQGEAVVLELEVDLDISRGAILVKGDSTPTVTRELDVKLVWLSEEPFAKDRGYLLRTATDLIPVAGLDIRGHLDLAKLAERPASGSTANDIAIGHIELGRSAVIDRYADYPTTGSFVLVDPLSGATIAAGVIVATKDRRATAAKGNVFRLTRDLLARGIGADLPVTDMRAGEELRRRANEVAILMREAGVAVEVEDTWHRSSFDPGTIWLGFLTVLSFGFVGAVLFGLV